ncbi:MAG TPA: hypothetical protein VII28_00325 [Puia sp.]
MARLVGKLYFLMVIQATIPLANAFVSQFVMVTGAIGEFPILFWLLIKGVKKNTPAIEKIS